MKGKKLKVALVCDWLTEVGGAEQVLLSLHKMYPKAPIYTSQYREGRIDWFCDADVRTGWLNIFPARFRRILAPLRQRYFSRLDLRGYDLVISVTGCDAKFVKTDGVHLCFCHCPTQYYWGKYEEYLKNPGFGIFNPVARAVFKRVAPKLREKDFKAAQNPTEIITISKHSRDEIKRFYKREAKIISPPVNTEFFAQYVDNYKIEKGKSQIKNVIYNTIKYVKKQIFGFSYKNIKIDKKQGRGAEQKFYTNLQNVENLDVLTEIFAKYPDGFYLNFSRQVSWKNLDFLVSAAKNMDLPLVLVGDGPENLKLRRLAGDSPLITFIKPLPKTDLAFLSSMAKAFIFPSEEPFGIAPVEAMSAGCPVIALKRGGALDYVKEKVNGFFFDELTEESLKETILKFEKRIIPLSRSKISKSVQKYSLENFEKKMASEIEKLGVIPRGKRPEIEKPVEVNLVDIKVEYDPEALRDIRKGLFVLLPAVLFFSNWPRIDLGGTESMNLKLTLPLIWLLVFALFNLKPAFSYFKKNLKSGLSFLIVPLLTLLYTSDFLRGVLNVGVIYCLIISVIGSLDLLRDKNLLQKLKKVFLSAAVFVSIFCILQMILDTVGVGREVTLLCSNCVSEIFGFSHVNGFSIEPQFMGSLMLAPYLLALNSLLENKNKKSQMNYLIVTILSLLVIFLTLSRGAIFAVSVATIVILIKNIKSLKKNLKIIAIFGLTFIFSLIFQGVVAQVGPTDANFVTGVNTALSQLTFNRLGRTTEDKKLEVKTNSSIMKGMETGSEVSEPETEVTEMTIETSNSPKFNGYIAESTNRRLELSRYALQISVENPTNLLFGTGIGSSGAEMLEHFPTQGHKKEIVQNQYLETLLEIGVVGIILIGVAVVTFIRLEKFKFEPVTFALILGFSVQILFFSGLPSALHVYLLPVVFYSLVKNDKIEIW